MGWWLGVGMRVRPVQPCNAARSPQRRGTCVCRTCCRRAAALGAPGDVSHAQPCSAADSLQQPGTCACQAQRMGSSCWAPPEGMAGTQSLAGWLGCLQRRWHLARCCSTCGLLRPFQVSPLAARRRTAFAAAAVPRSRSRWSRLSLCHATPRNWTILTAPVPQCRAQLQAPRRYPSRTAGALAWCPSQPTGGPTSTSPATCS